MASVAIPVALFKGSVTWLYSVMVGADRTVISVAAGVLAATAAAVGLAAAGAFVPVCLLVIVLALGASILVDERRGSERLHGALTKLEAEAAAPQA